MNVTDLGGLLHPDTPLQTLRTIMLAVLESTKNQKPMMRHSDIPHAGALTPCSSGLESSNDVVENVTNARSWHVHIEHTCWGH